MPGIVFSLGYVLRRSFRATGWVTSRWVAMCDAARERQARCINRSDTFDSSVRTIVKRAR